VPAGVAVTPIEEDKQTHDHDLERERCLLFVLTSAVGRHIVR
jgi:hypothetical protein